MAQAIKFYKGTMPTSLTVGTVYFDTTTKTIKVATSTSAYDEFGGKISDASFANNKLTITKADGSTVVVDLSDVASASGINTILAAMKVNGKALFTSSAGQSITLTGADVKLTGLSTASSYTAPAATDTINAAIAKLVKGVANASSAASDAKTAADDAASDAQSAIQAANTAQEEVDNLNNDLNAIKVNGHNLRLDSVDDPDNGTVLDGSDIKLTGLTAASSYTAPAATDTINAAIAKLVKGIANASSSASSAAQWANFT